MSKISGIYLITNLKNNKHYVGRSTNCYDRISKHKSALRKSIHHNSHLQNSWKEYGENNFIFEIIETYESIFLPSFENWWCNMLNTHNRLYGYNIEPTSYFGKIHTSDETKEKIRISNTGKIVSDATKIKIRKANVGKKHNARTIEKLKNNSKNIAVDVYDKEGNFIQTYKSIRECARVLNIDNKNIEKCISGEYNLIKEKIIKKNKELLSTDEIINRNKNSHSNKKIKVFGYKTNGEFIGKFNSIYEAGIKNNLDSYKISLCIQGKQKKTKNTVWLTSKR